MRSQPQSNMSFHAQTGMTLATRWVLGGENKEIDIGFLKFKGKPYIDITITIGTEGLIVQGKIHGNFYLDFNIVQAAVTHLIVGAKKEPGMGLAATIECRFGLNFGISKTSGDGEVPDNMAFFRAKIEKSSDEL